MCYIFQVGSGFLYACQARSDCASIPPRIAVDSLGRVAQLAEHSALNRQVVGSIPTASTI